VPENVQAEPQETGKTTMKIETGTIRQDSAG
jgi:hypothetical protein